MSKPGTIDIHGNEYKTVALRVYELRKDQPLWTLKTALINHSATRVVFKATLLDEEGRTIATGHAEEAYDKDQTNQDSALEVCETSAVGRCLAFASWPGSELEFDPNIASADEVSHAIKKQFEKEQGAYMAVVHEHWDSITFIKSELAIGNLSAAYEAWQELGNQTMQDLWKAPTKGGVFTTVERNQLNDAATNAFTSREE